MKKSKRERLIILEQELTEWEEKMKVMNNKEYWRATQTATNLANAIRELEEEIKIEEA